MTVEGLELIESLLESGSFDGFVDCDAIIDGRNVGTYSITWKVIEKRAYLIPCHTPDLKVNGGATNNIVDELFMQLAETNGTVFTLNGFVAAVNKGELDLRYFYIRFI